ncbi:MAG: SCO family protein [Chitinophagaceae bacterium]|nr:SCO family protein [Chitinophagaceae bacterium]
MTKKNWIYTGFFALLVLGFYFLVSAIIPNYNKVGVAPVSFVRPFSFYNQDGNLFTDKDIKGKVYVAEYFFTTCKGICPKMNQNMRQVYDKFKGEKDFLILSHTCDPDNDSVPIMKKYSDSMQVDTKQWVFLTGRKDSLYNMARISYTIDDPANNLTDIKDQFLHTQFWALVDRNGDVRKIYDGLKQREINLLLEDIAKELKR